MKIADSQEPQLGSEVPLAVLPLGTRATICSNQEDIQVLKHGAYNGLTAVQSTWSGLAYIEPQTRVRPWIGPPQATPPPKPSSAAGTKEVPAEEETYEAERERMMTGTASIAAELAADGQAVVKRRKG